jgi:tRNA(fMet)-specific endonuclease VapC
MNGENSTMTEELCLTDTDIFSYILKRLEPAYQQSREYLKKHNKFTISCFTYYECLRGYKAVRATNRMKIFKEFLELTEVLYLNQEILDKAGEIYSILKNEGKLIGEFDMLIGATAIVHDFTLVTNNERHYESIKEHFPLKITNWMK